MGETSSPKDVRTRRSWEALKRPTNVPFSCTPKPRAMRTDVRYIRMYSSILPAWFQSALLNVACGSIIAGEENEPKLPERRLDYIPNAFRQKTIHKDEAFT